MSSLKALPFFRNQRRSFTPRTQITSTTPAMGRKKVIGHTDVLGMVPLSASLSCGRYPRTALWIHFGNVFQQVTLSLLLVLKEDPPSSLLEEKKSEQLGLPQTLQQEFSLINVQIRNVNVEVLRFSVSRLWLVAEGTISAMIWASKLLFCFNRAVSVLAFLFRFCKEIINC